MSDQQAGASGPFAGRRIAVIGLGRSGLDAATVLQQCGAKVLLSDQASGEAIAGRVAEAKRRGLKVLLNADAAHALREADLVVTSPGVPLTSDVLVMASRRGIPIMSEIEVAYLISKAPIIAITGTNGKTTTTVMIGDILRAGGRTAHVGGNISADDLKQTLVAAATKARADEVIVAEISSFQLEHVQWFRPQVGVLTNVSPDHITRHGDYATYAACKARLFAAQLPTDVAVVNAVNATARRIGLGLRSRVTWFDQGAPAGAAGDYASVRNGVLGIEIGGQRIDIMPACDLKVRTQANIDNALAAAAATLAFGVHPEAIASALRAFIGVVHRMEYVADLAGVTYVNNSMCTNAKAAESSLLGLPGPAVLIAGGDPKGTDMSIIGPQLAQSVRHLVVLEGDRCRFEEIALASGLNSISRAADMEEAVAQAAAAACSGDTVMLSPGGATIPPYRDFEDRGEAFRAAVRALGARQG